MGLEDYERPPTLFGLHGYMTIIAACLKMMFG